MSFWDNVRLGLNTYGQATNFIFRHRLWVYILVPGIINIVLFLATWKTGNYYAEQGVNALLDLFGLSGEQEGFLSWIKSVVFFFVNLGVKILVLLLYLTVYKYIVLIILSPVLALLSERVDEIITGVKYPFNFSRFAKDVVRGILIALRNIILELLLTLLFWIGSFIPLVGLVAPVGMFFVQSYYYGFSMIDYSNERHRLGVGESIRFIRSHKGLAIANGALFYLMFLIPFVGWMFAPTLGVVAATLAVNEVRKKTMPAVTA